MELEVQGLDGEKQRESGLECGLDGLGYGHQNGGQSEECGFQSEDDWECGCQSGEQNEVLIEIQSRERFPPCRGAVQTQSEES